MFDNMTMDQLEDINDKARNYIRRRKEYIANNEVDEKETAKINNDIERVSRYQTKVLKRINDIEHSNEDNAAGLVKLRNMLVI